MLRGRAEPGAGFGENRHSLELGGLTYRRAGRPARGSYRTEAISVISACLQVHRALPGTHPPGPGGLRPVQVTGRRS